MKCKEERNVSSGEAACQKWDNLIETAVCGKPFLQVKLVEKLNEYGNISEACKFARKYYIAPAKLPHVLSEMQEYVSTYRDQQNVDVKKFSGGELGSTGEDWEEEVSSVPVVSFSLVSQKTVIVNNITS